MEQNDEDEAAPPTPGATKVVLSASAEFACYSERSEQLCWAVTNLKAPYYEPTSRAPVDIVAVIDKSGSMGGQKIQLVKKTLLFVVDQVKDCDRFSLVMYDTSVKVLFGLMKMNKENKERAKSLVQSIESGTSTNLCGGLLKGMEEIALTHGGEKAQVQSVLLLTDGLANHGITSKEGIIREMKKMQDEGLGALTKYQQAANPLAPPVSRPPMQAPVQQQQAAMQQPLPPPPMQAPMQQQQAAMQQPLPPMQAPVQQQQAAMQQPLPPMQAPMQQQQAAMQQPLPPMQTRLQQQQAAMKQQMQQQMLMSHANAPPPPPPFYHQRNAQPVELEELDPATSGYKFDGTVYTFGFGSDHDAGMLEAISTQGGGVYYYIDSNEKIPESFADCLGGLLSVVGQNLSLKLETVGINLFKAVHANRTINWSTPNKCCEIPMGDLQSEEERDIVLELSLPALPGPIEGDLAVRAQLSYFNVITSEMDTLHCELAVNRMDGEKGPGIMTVDVQRNRILATTVLRQAESLADNNKLAEAQAALKSAIQTLETSLSREQDFCKALVSDMKTCLQSMTSQHAYHGHGKLMVKNRIQSHSVQRSNFAADNMVYQNKSKKMFSSKAKNI